MSKYTLIKTGDPGDEILKTPLDTVDKPGAQIEILKAMVKVMKEHKGIGLTASQIGLNKRMFVMMMNADDRVNVPSYPLFVINPKIIKVGKQKNMNKEACLSYPGKDVSVSRPIDIWVAFHDGRKSRRMKMHGLDARVFLHEYDHCEGECIVSKLSTLDTLEKKKEKVEKNNKKG